MYKIVALALLGSLMACSGRKTETSEAQTNNTALDTSPDSSAFAKDRQFLKRHHPDLVELENGDARALICPAYQGRVMTSSADGKSSYGWINYDLISSGKLLPHMNAFGGEDRFWLGPEGGQFALYFKPGDPFDATHWQTPAAIDSEPFTRVESSASSVRFTRDVALTNYTGTQFDLGIERTVRLLTKAEINAQLGQETSSLKVVGIESDNKITNKGKQAWTTQTGMPSIWILGMMNASPKATIIVPFRPGAGQPINDSYFGKVPANRLRVGKTAALFTADANYRSKIGVSPARATKWIGSYDPANQTLTLVTYDFDPVIKQYVNSAWELQKEPFSGDVVNAYNDGPMKPGQPQMGQFYELESSSPAAQLSPGGTQQHRHITFHIQGPEQQLNKLANQLLQINLADM
ncbi:DUF6786 family protein [Spirosoma linguale]|uniref:Lipoprotein n=1 Tax=Spirosoma linguale (strain ATCC 33905 / DSM 74 / LMG 10896 / Claus 1) TaxID=504472 RepID=D2QMF8_SPILD|nr:hypothetical protein Slin_3210 [Spirosoma linguale DSM 74]